jgi:Uroporphyrinogen decarboxylase (URO-D)
MNQRERFLALFNYEPIDRIPIWDFGFWDQTLREWRTQGMPEDAHPDDFFGMDRQWEWLPVDVGLRPAFEPKLLKEDGEFQWVVGGDGVVVRQPKDFTSMPEFVDYTLKDRATWEEHYAWRLDPNAEGRIGHGYGSNDDQSFAERCKKLAERDYPVLVHCGSVLGSIRNWWGLENFSYIQFDDPELLAEMIQTVGDCVVATLDRALAQAKEFGVTVDMGHFWEDICYNHGPLVNPKLFRELAVPQIKRITDTCRKYGCDLLSVDCDGKIDELILPWREAGVQTMFPLEIGDWADPVEMRQRFGKELLLFGGIDKRTLAKSKADIDAMIEHLTPLIEDGAFLPTPDHRVPPTVSLENYIYYLDRIKDVWGHGLPDIRPTGKPVA